MSEILLIKKEKKLSKAQESFNKLIKRIESKTKQVEIIEGNLRKYFNKRNRELSAIAAERMNCQVKYVLFLDEVYEKQKLSKKEKESLAEMIVSLSLAYDEEEPQHPELLRIISKYNQLKFAQLDKSTLEMSKPFIEQMMKEEFGIDLDLSDTGEFDYETLQQKFASMMADARQEQMDNDSSRRKNKHEAGSTARSKAMAEQLNQSWKKIYLSLVKKLHPDTEMNEKLKAGKDAALKEVTVAYENNNFYKLLELQIKHLEQTDLLHTTDDKILKEYLRILKKQEEEIQGKLNETHYFLFSRHLSPLSDKRNADPYIAMRVIREKKEMEEQIEGLKDELLIFSDIKQLKKELKSIKTTHLQNGTFDEDDLFFFK